MGMDSTLVGAQLVREVAQDMTALRDPDLILTGLVRRVKAALGCDLVYVSLNDSVTRDTEIRFSEGIRTPAYRSIRMPIGTGVLGMGAAGVTTETADYLRDVGKFHVDDVDAAVRAEGVAAILSTPLRAGDDVVGTLTVANRSPGPFDDAQRGVLREAALMGSIAVELYELRRQLSAQEEAARDNAERLQLATELSSALLLGEGTSELLAVSSRAVGGRVELGDTGDDPGAPETRRIALEVGGAVDIDDTDPTRVSALAPTIATFVSISLLYEAAIEDARHLRESELAERLIDARGPNPGRPLRAGLAGDGPLGVYVIHVVDPNRRRAAANALRKMLGRTTLVVDRRHEIVVISRTLRLDQLTPLLAEYRFHAGRARADDEAAVAQAYDEASLVARSMRALNRAGEVGTRQELGVVAFALEDTAGSAHRLVETYLAPLLTGADREARLRETALAFLDAQGSVADVARALSIHTNTVRQRLDKLDELVPGWRHGPRSLDVHVALRAHALMAARAHDGK